MTKTLYSDLAPPPWHLPGLSVGSSGLQTRLRGILRGTVTAVSRRLEWADGLDCRRLGAMPIRCDGPRPSNVRTLNERTQKKRRTFKKHYRSSASFLRARARRSGPEATAVITGTGEDHIGPYYTANVLDLTILPGRSNRPEACRGQLDCLGGSK